MDVHSQNDEIGPLNHTQNKFKVLKINNNTTLYQGITSLPHTIGYQTKRLVPDMGNLFPDTLSQQNVAMSVDTYLLTNVGAHPTVGTATPGQLGLGCIRKVAEPTMASKEVGSVSLLQFLTQGFFLNSYPDFPR